MNLAKILKLATVAMLLITVVFVLLFSFGGDLPNELYTTPVYTDQLLWWTYILFFISVISALIFPLMHIFTRPKSAMKGLISLLLLIVIVGVSYSLGDGTLMNIPGYSGPDNNPETLIFSDMILFTMYILGFASVAAIVVTEIYKKVK